MAWNTEMVTMLRVLINDTESPQTYTDARLENLLVVGAVYVNQEIDFTTTYTITISSPDISPDPTATATKDQAFANLVVLKSACLADQSTYRTKAIISGLQSKCGPATLQTLRHLDGFKELLTLGPCAAYETLKENYQRNDTNVLFAIFSPFISDDFNPSHFSDSFAR